MNFSVLQNPVAAILVPSFCALFVCNLYGQEIADDLELDPELEEDNVVLDVGEIIEGDVSQFSLETITAADEYGAEQEADDGIQIQVERSTDVSGDAIEPGVIRVYSPWPAKPMAEAPAGWSYVPAPQQIEPYKQEVKLGSGKTVELSITPFILVPVTDGSSVIRVAEPGYDPSMQFAQENTVGSMLHKSTMEIEENEKHAAKAISLLQQLLSTLPQQK